MTKEQRKEMDLAALKQAVKLVKLDGELITLLVKKPQQKRKTIRRK